MIKKLINESGNIVVFDYAIAYSNGYEIGPSGAVQTVSSKRAVGHYFW